MGKQKNYEVIGENELGFLQVGDYFIPDIKLQLMEEKRLSKYGRMRRVFLQKNNPLLFDDLVLTEQLFPHLYEAVSYTHLIPHRREAPAPTTRYG